MARVCQVTGKHRWWEQHPPATRPSAASCRTCKIRILERAENRWVRLRVSTLPCAPMTKASTPSSPSSAHMAKGLSLYTAGDKPKWQRRPRKIQARVRCTAPGASTPPRRTSARLRPSEFNKYDPLPASTCRTREVETQVIASARDYRLFAYKGTRHEEG